MTSDPFSRVCVTGGCGFLGRHLVRELLKRQVQRLSVLDNLSVGDKASLPTDSRIFFTQGDIRNMDALQGAVEGCDTIFHFAAPTNVRTALTDPRLDIDHGVLGTQNVLECARQAGSQRIIFASSSCIYGDGLSLPVPEHAGPLLPSSIYGASKLAAEALIAAYCHTFSMQGWIYRFPNVVGPEMTHGVILDFIAKLRSEPKILPIFGDGSQTKTYLWSADCVAGVLALTETLQQRVNVANITAPGATSVTEIAAIVIQEMGLANVRLEYSGGPQGWLGDVPVIQLDGSLASHNDWFAQHTSSEAIGMTARYLLGKDS